MTNPQANALAAARSRTLPTKFVRLREPVALGHRLPDGWRVCWVGGRDKGRLFFLVLVVRQDAGPSTAIESKAPRPLCR